MMVYLGGIGGIRGVIAKIFSVKKRNIVHGKMVSKRKIAVPK
jgi:hypothetical protein